MGLDMYFNKIKKNKYFDKQTMIMVANSLYAKNDTNKEFFKPFEKAGLTYTYTRWECCGEETYLEKNIAYWRKANAIHNWIYQNCAEQGQQDYDYIIVEKEKIEELIKICKEVLEDLKKCPTEKKQVQCGWNRNKSTYIDILVYDSKLADKLLPTTAGFFFGGTEYDDYYKVGLEDTITQLLEVLKDTDWENEVVYYHASY